MIIANPIYDSVFKRLIEDMDIAKELIGRLIEARVIELEPRPQEVTRLSPALGVDGKTLRYFRMDYAAIIETALPEPTSPEKKAGKGQTKKPKVVTEKRKKRTKVLIELQRASEGPSIIRFRNYLSAHYAIPIPHSEKPSLERKASDVTRLDEKSAQPEVLPIIAIYLLGFNPFKFRWPVIRVDPTCRNLITGKRIAKPDSEFVDALNHTSVIVQLRRLSNRPKTNVEKAVTVFKQMQEDIVQVFEVPEWVLKIDDPLVKRMLRCLEKVSADSEARMLMEAEDAAWNVQSRLEHAEKVAEEECRLKEEALRSVHEERRLKEAAISEMEKMREALKRAGLDADDSP